MKENDQILLTSQIEKYKNEAWIYKCERDELKVSLNNLKIERKSNEKDFDKKLLKVDKYKEKIHDLEKQLLKNEGERNEIESKFTKENNEVKIFIYDCIIK